MRCFFKLLVLEKHTNYLKTGVNSTITNLNIINSVGLTVYVEKIKQYYLILILSHRLSQSTPIQLINQVYGSIKNCLRALFLNKMSKPC